jgi:hypothetical protein
MDLRSTQPLIDMSTRNLPEGNGRLIGCAVTQAVSRWLPIAAARVRVRAA